MCWEYLYLKQALSLELTPCLKAFEAYCAQSYAAVERCEWSVKFSRGTAVADRFLHVGRLQGSRDEATVADLLGLTENLEPRILEIFNRLIRDNSERVLVGYQTNRNSSDRCECLKIYLQLCEAPEWLHDTMSLEGQWPGKFPGNPGIMYRICFGNSHKLEHRLYVAYDDSEICESSVRERLEDIVGARLVRFLASYPRCMIAFDSQGPSQIYVAMWDALDTEMNFIARDLAQSEPLLSARIDRMTWVGLDLDDVDKDVPEMFNIYVNLGDSSSGPS